VYVEDLNDARTKYGGKRVLPRRGQACEKRDFFNMLLDQPTASSHFLQFKVSPRCWLRPWSVRTQGRFVIGGWCRTC